MKETILRCETLAETVMRQVEKYQAAQRAAVAEAKSAEGAAKLEEAEAPMRVQTEKECNVCLTAVSEGGVESAPAFPCVSLRCGGSIPTLSCCRAGIPTRVWTVPKACSASQGATPNALRVARC